MRSLARSLVVAGSVLLAASGTTPTFAFGLPPAPTNALVAAPMGSAAGATDLLATTKKKKKKKSSSTSETVTIENIPSVKRGKSDFKITAKLSKSDRTCTLKVKFADDSTVESDEVDADGKRCEMSIDIPDERDAAGSATATVTVRDSKGKKVGTAKKTFTVK